VHELRRERVNADALSTGELELSPLDADDRALVTDLLRRHHDETGSTLGARLLAEGDAALDRFVKVLPRDFAAVLATRQTALDEGLDPDGDVVWGRILEVTGG
jgi:glutamate synthase (NADPH/NADH) large chain